MGKYFKNNNLFCKLDKIKKGEVCTTTTKTYNIYCNYYVMRKMKGISNLINSDIMNQFESFLWHFLFTSQINNNGMCSVAPRQ